MTRTITADKLTEGTRVLVSTGLSRTGKAKVREVVAIRPAEGDARFVIVTWSGRKSGEWVERDAEYQVA